MGCQVAMATCTIGCREMPPPLKTSAMPPNGSGLDACEIHSFPSSHTLPLVGYSLLMPLGALLNGLSLWVFLRWLRPHSVVSIFMCNLALSDLLFSLSLPLRIYYFAEHHWPFGPFLCRLSGSIFHINMYGSCLFLLCINLDRYLAVVYPLRFRHLRRPKVAHLTCLCVWLLILAGSVPAASIHTSLDCWDGNSAVQRCFEGLSSWQDLVFPLLVVAEVLGFLLPLGGVLYGSCRVFWVLGRAQERWGQRHLKTIRLLLLNLSIFLFCFVPYNTALVAYGLLRAKVLPASPDTVLVVKKALAVTVLLASTNCALDPLVYYFSTEGFRRTLSKIGGRSMDSEVKGVGPRGKWWHGKDSVGKGGYGKDSVGKGGYGKDSRGKGGHGKSSAGRGQGVKSGITGGVGKKGSQGRVNGEDRRKPILLKYQIEESEV
ncbi:lysophosphatidic acid receptor 5 isoform X2 [Ascaphus truei]|uniref:lysophosphatidic acid receptor 5 isoform X2 n=1 Tax=Ascaphus truei TaxID=8439 RepID=UPI003F5A658B